MSSLDESLRRILAVEGVRSAALIDLATGMVVRSAGAEPATLPEAAASLAGEVRAADQAQGPLRPGGDLDEIALFTAGRLHLTEQAPAGVLLHHAFVAARGRQAQPLRALAGGRAGVGQVPAVGGVFGDPHRQAVDDGEVIRLRG